ncbi:MAG: hypothetical protein HY342_04330 [Candidatus Lambdaproteobacteria bacterium]|nr:hypothetical protein [Candidatus Lambdaproteobacteria bacterium]
MTWGPWPLYPGFWALSLIVVLYLKQSPPPRPQTPLPLRALLALAAWMTGLSVWREQWALAAVTAGGAALCYAWGLAAHRLARLGHLEPSLLQAQPQLLGVVLGLGLLTALAGAAWPPLCRALSCDAGAPWPPPLLGVWLDPAQFLLFLVLLLPGVGALLVLRHRGLLHAPPLWALLLLVGAALVAALTGASVPTLLLLLAALGGLVAVLWPERHPADRRLLAGLATFVLFAAVVLYGAVPAYLQRLGTERAGGLVTLSLAAPAPETLTSQAVTLLPVRIVNAGWRTLSADARRPAELAVRILFTDRLGITRLADERRVPLRAPLPPEAASELQAPLAVPPWLRGGFVALLVYDGQGRPVPHGGDSLTGFRYRNPAYRPLTEGDDNWLSPLAQRARRLAQLPAQGPAGRLEAQRSEHLLGELLDVLVFAPLWGEGPPAGAGVFPFSAPWPALAQIFHGYGLIGVALAGWVCWDLVRRARWIAGRASRATPLLGWRLVPLAVGLLVLSGLFWNTLGSLHAVWGLFLLAGFTEGRHALLAPPLRVRAWWPAPHWPRLPRLWPAPRPRLWPAPRPRRRLRRAPRRSR